MRPQHQDRDQEGASQLLPLHHENARKLRLLEGTWNRIYVSQKQLEACQQLSAESSARVKRSKALLAHQPSPPSSSPPQRALAPIPARLMLDEIGPLAFPGPSGKFCCCLRYRVCQVVQVKWFGKHRHLKLLEELPYVLGERLVGSRHGEIDVPGGQRGSGSQRL